MLICHVINSLNRGGAETHLFDLIKEQINNNDVVKHIDIIFDMEKIQNSYDNNDSNNSLLGDNNDSNLVFLDAGLVVELTDRDRTNFLRVFKAVAEKNGRLVGQLMLEQAKYENCPDHEKFISGIDSPYQAAKLRSASSKALRVFTSRSFEGSSRRRTFEDCFKRRASCTRFLSPPERTDSFFC